ncbi:hypothetical protein [Aestuariispira ectoiniformans]|uniref:hypothetical protein n=1 Tax=Aestuariispira ectoiniformans TaxID=2775080 RepID=UPI00223B2EF0|nr:hypothetical protein [Aestuariispira ectoiniformans]
MSRRNKQNWDGETEEYYLNTLHRVADSGRTQAQLLAERFQYDWNGDITQIYREYSY